MRALRDACGAALLAACGIAAGSMPGAAAAGGVTWRVGPARALATPAAAAQRAQDGDTVEVDAGDYAADVAVWTQDDLTLRAVGGRARLAAAGAAAEGKAIWVVRGGRVRIEGFEFRGARVAGRNGAGIRFERGRLEVRDCRFSDNEMGLLAGNDTSAELVVTASEFDHNQRPDGHDHNLYVGTIARLTVTESYFHHARTGHLLKSRAASSRILYNRISDEAGGAASYELEFPNGGEALVVGNVIAQAATTENPVLVAYGLEGWRWPVNTLTLVHNTLVDGLAAGGIFLRVAPGHGTVRAIGNLLVGAGAGFEGIDGIEAEGNVRVGAEALACIACGDYRLEPHAAAALGPVRDATPSPKREYLHPRASVALSEAPTLPGALQRTAAP